MHQELAAQSRAYARSVESRVLILSTFELLHSKLHRIYMTVVVVIVVTIIIISLRWH